MRAVQVSEFGGPEVLRVAELPDPQPADGHTVIDVRLAGINYADTHQAENSYLSKQDLPFVPGAEVVGTTADGRRVAAIVQGGYAQRALAAIQTVFDIPDGIDDATACALVLQGASAWHLVHTSGHVRSGESVVVHAGAGGVGSLAVQIARHAGAGRVIATASSPEKRRLALELGADAAVDSRVPDMKAALIEANAGRRVDVVFEMVGGRVLDGSLAALAPFGRLVVYGMASRQPATPIDPAKLMGRSHTVAGFWLAHCFADPRRMLAEPLEELFNMVRKGDLRAVIGGTYPLSEAQRAHEDLRSRATVGKLLLDPAQ